MTMLRSQFPDFVMADALPFLEFVVDDTWASQTPRFEKIFKVKQMHTGVAQSSQVSSFQAAGQVGEAEQVPLQKLVQGFDKTYTALKYGLMTSTSEELIADLDFDVFKDRARKLAKAVMETAETVSANVFNNAFSTTGPDGKVLCASDHPLLAPGAGTGTNLLGTAADLSMTSLKAAITLMDQQVDTAGNKIRIDPSMLLVHPDNRFLAVELLKSGYLVDSANANVNAINSVQSEFSIAPMSWNFLTDADAWFLVSKPEDHNLCFYWRQRPEISSKEQFETGVMLHKILARFDVGYSDWRGVVGTPGT